MMRPLGLTLLEMLVVLALIAIMATIGISAMPQLLAHHRLQGAGKMLYQDLQWARLRALGGQYPVYVSFKPGAAWCYGVNDNVPCDCREDNSCQLRQVKSSEFKGVVLSMIEPIDGNIKFNGAHGLVADAANLELTVASNDIKLQVNQGGLIVICSTSTIGGLSPC